MIRACRAAMAAAGLLGKLAVGLVALIMLVGAVLPTPPPPDARPRSEPGEPARSSDSVVLTIPDGKPAGHLTVVDASGREIATLTHWPNGNTAVVTRRGVGPTVGCYHKAEGNVFVLVSGTAGETQIRVEPDGTTKSAASDPSRFVNPPMLRETRNAEHFDPR